MLLPALLTTLVLAQPQPTVEAREQRGVDALAVPLVGYTSDLGLGFGLAGGMLIYGPGYRPYRHSIGFSSYFTRAGVQRHSLRWDAPRFVDGLRLEVGLELRRELYMPFAGPGNLSGPDFSELPRDRAQTYFRRTPGGWARARWRPLGESSVLQTYVGLAYRDTRVRAYEGSVLAALQPPGIEGGMVGQALLGALWDTRDNEPDTTRGGLTEVGVRLADPVIGSKYRFGGVTVGTRQFWRLGGRVVLAERVMFDHLFGDVPFFEWPNIGGLSLGLAEGIGGEMSVRGIPRDRYVGNTKVFSNTEARVHLLQFPLLGGPVRVGALALVDVGRVWHPRTPDGPWYLWHPGVGAGLRAARGAAVVRFDWAFSPETRGQRVYLTFGHMF